jgi:hypothetical protein
MGKITSTIKEKVLKIKPEIIETDDEEKENMSAKDILKAMMEGNAKNQGMSDDDVKDIENIKLIISAMLNDALLKSLSNLPIDERDDLRDALLINQYADNPRLETYIIDTLKLSRSVTSDNKNYSNLLQIFSDISGKGMRTLSEGFDKGVLGGRFGK